MMALDTAERGAATSSRSTEAAIQTDNLVKRYGTTVALTGLTMTVSRGEVFGFLGPNGAGKTTAVKLLTGLARPTAGHAWLLGKPLGDREARRRIGYLPELFRYQDWLTAREVLGLHCDLAGIDRKRRAATIDEALTLVGLAERGNDRVGTFSKGMQQRLGLGVALLGEPDLVFLDEPTSALDPVGRHDVRLIIRTLKERGTAVFLNSHLLSEVEQVCDRVAIVDRGRVIAQGNLADLQGLGRVVRIRVEPLPAVTSILSTFGVVEIEDPWVTVRGVGLDAVPDLVARLAAAGARIYAVEPHQESLEDRFLDLLGGTHGDSHNHSPHPA